MSFNKRKRKKEKRAGGLINVCFLSRQAGYSSSSHIVLCAKNLISNFLAWVICAKKCAMKEEKTNLLHRVMRDGNGFCCQLFLKIGKIDRRQLSVLEPSSLLCAIKNNEKVYRGKIIVCPSPSVVGQVKQFLREKINRSYILCVCPVPIRTHLWRIAVFLEKLLKCIVNNEERVVVFSSLSKKFLFNSNKLKRKKVSK